MEQRKARVVFVDNFYFLRTGGRIDVQVSPHLGLMSLAAVLEGAGHEVEIFDPKLLFLRGRWTTPDRDFFAACADAICASDAQVVGFTALGRTLTYAVSIARELRARDASIPIIAGGPQVTVVGEAFMRAFDCFDAIVRFEAESLIAELVERLVGRKPLDLMPNLVFRAPAGQLVKTPEVLHLPPMDSLPFPAMHLYPLKELKTAELAIEAGRGCPFACTFCSTATFFQRRYRLKPNALLLDEMERLRAEYGVDAFDLNHDLFGLHKASFVDFCQRVTGRGFRWKCSMRPDTLDPRLLPMMEAAGCTSLYFGIETGSSRMQRVVKKKLDLDATWKALTAVFNTRIHCTTSFITGFPDESMDDQDSTLDYIGKILAHGGTNVTAQLHVLSPEPGSELTTPAPELCFDGLGPELDDLMDREMVAAHPAIMSVFYHFRTQLPRWRVTMGSAFVTYLLPELGVPLTLHLAHTLCDGSLARLFRLVVPQDPGDVAGYADIVELLWGGVASMLERREPRMRHLGDLYRLSRLLSLAKDHLTFTSRGTAPATEATAFILVRMHEGIVETARRILTNPCEPVDDGDGQRVDTWHLVTCSCDGSSMLAPLSDEQASEFDSLLPSDALEPGTAKLLQSWDARMMVHRGKT